MAESHNGDDLYEDKFARVYAEIVRIDQLRVSEAAASRTLDLERDRRLDERMDAADKAVAAALSAADKAVTAALIASEKGVSKAELAQAKVNEGQNEFRGSLKDQAQTLMPRSETENLVRELRGLINGQAAEIAGLRSRVDVGPPSLAAIQARSDAGEGRRTGATDMRTAISATVAAVASMLAIASLIVAYTK